MDTLSPYVIGWAVPTALTTIAGYAADSTVTPSDGYRS